jgi:hypothetical protein
MKNTILTEKEFYNTFNDNRDFSKTKEEISSEENIIKATENTIKYINDYNRDIIIDRYCLFDNVFIYKQLERVYKIYKQVQTIIDLENNLREDIKKTKTLIMLYENIYKDYSGAYTLSQALKEKKKMYKKITYYIEKHNSRKNFKEIIDIYGFLYVLYESIIIKCGASIDYYYEYYFENTKAERIFLLNQAKLYRVNIDEAIASSISPYKYMKILKVIHNKELNDKSFCFNNESDIDSFVEPYMHKIYF